MELIGDFEECGESDNGTKYSSIKQLFEKEDLLVDDNRRVWYHNAGLFGLLNGLILVGSNGCLISIFKSEILGKCGGNRGWNAWRKSSIE